jgi:hypothetical protein
MKIHRLEGARKRLSEDLDPTGGKVSRACLIRDANEGVTHGAPCLLSDTGLREPRGGKLRPTDPRTDDDRSTPALRDSVIRCIKDRHLDRIVAQRTRLDLLDKQLELV